MKNNTNLKNTLTIRYLIAVGIIAFVITGGYIILMAQLSAGKHDSYIINISGMQRMLSQRIALMATQINAETSDDLNDQFIAKMTKSVTMMQNNHQELTTGKFADGLDQDLSKNIKNAYFGDGNLDERVSGYLHLGESLLNEYNSKTIDWAEIRELERKLVAIARNGLLRDLNEVVFIYEAEAKQAVEEYTQLETYIFLVGIIVLIMEILFIFRPMVRNIIAANRSLKESNDELVEFSYRISHDLRAPIVSSLGLSRATSEALENKNYDMAKPAIGHITTSMEKLEKLVSDILSLTKLKSMEAKIEEVNIEEMIAEICEKMNNLENYDKITINKQIDIPNSFKAKRWLLQQTLENLISNAIKYSDISQDEPKIDIIAKEEHGNYEFSVKDNGIGVPEEYSDMLFGMFKRFHPKVSFGTGLGLYLVQKQAEMMGGGIEYSSLQKGSCFKLTIKKI